MHSTGYTEQELQRLDAHQLLSRNRGPRRQLSPDSLKLYQHCQMRQGEFCADVMVMDRSVGGTELSLLVLSSNDASRVGRNIRYGNDSSEPAGFFPSNTFPSTAIHGGLRVYSLESDREYEYGRAEQHMHELLTMIHRERAESALLKDTGRAIVLRLEVGGRYRRFPAPPRHLFPALLELLKHSCVQVHSNSPSLFKGDITYSMGRVRRKAACCIEDSHRAHQAFLAISRA